MEWYINSLLATTRYENEIEALRLQILESAIFKVSHLCDKR